MTGRTLRFIIVLLASAVLLAVVGICLYATINTSDMNLVISFAESVVRTMVLFIFLVFYYNSLFSGSGLDTAFLPMFLLFSMVLELRILSEFSAVTFIMPLEPVVLNRILTFSVLMTGFSIFGFSFFYQNREPSAVTYYILLSIAFAVITALLIPATQNIDVMNRNLNLSLFVSALYSASAILFLRQIILDPPGSYLIRHFSALLFLVGNIINIYFDNMVFNLAGTAFTVLCYTTVMLVSKASDVKY